MPGTWRSLAVVALLSICGAVWLSCAKDPLRVDRNRPPNTFLVAAPVDTSVAEIRYSYRVHLYWRGEDVDGFVVGFLYSWDDSSIGAFRFTTKTDSVFELTVNDSSQITGTGANPGTTRAHTFYIRAVDNLGKPDPTPTIFNQRPFKATTAAPLVSFVGDIRPHPHFEDDPETPEVEKDPIAIDTLCDGAPFKICWTARDPDGAVTRYRYDIGSFNSPLTTDTCAYFNDPGRPGAVPIASGRYTMTVTAVDNANAVGKSTVPIVVNRDPRTWFLPKTSEFDQARPIGHYIQHYLRGQPVRIEGIFYPGETVPHRSTVWWEWDGEDSHGGCEANCLTGWSFRLLPGTRNEGEGYLIGYLNTLSAGPPVIRFNSNHPDRMQQAGFTSLILDSLDAGINMVVQVASRDCANRGDGTPDFFEFHCNFRPTVTSLTVNPVMADPENTGTPEPCQEIVWTSEDFEDGLAKGATVTLDDTQKNQFTHYEQSTVVPDRVFRGLSPSGPHSVGVRVQDRGEFLSENELEVRFDLPSPSP